MTKHRLNLVWMDLEMTGLDPEWDRIIEIATVVTDADLRIIEQGPVIAINQSTKLLDGMDEWNTRTHNKTGLVTRIKQSSLRPRERSRFLPVGSMNCRLVRLSAKSVTGRTKTSL